MASKKEHDGIRLSEITAKLGEDDVSEDEFKRLKRLGSHDPITLYHQTNANAAFNIIDSQRFNRGAVGLVGGGIYFAGSGKMTQGKAHSNGVILKCKVRLGNQKYVDAVNCRKTATYPQYTFTKLLDEGYDSVAITGMQTGMEYVIYNSDQATCIEQFSGQIPQRIVALTVRRPAPAAVPPPAVPPPAVNNNPMQPEMLCGQTVFIIIMCVCLIASILSILVLTDTIPNDNNSPENTLALSWCLGVLTWLPFSLVRFIFCHKISSCGKNCCVDMLFFVIVTTAVVIFVVKDDMGFYKTMNWSRTISLGIGITCGSFLSISHYYLCTLKINRHGWTNLGFVRRNHGTGGYTNYLLDCICTNICTCIGIGVIWLIVMAIKLALS